MADGGGSTADQWALAPAERELVMTKNRATWLGFAILLTFFRERGRFPRDGAEVAAQSIAVLCQQLAVPTPVDGEAFPTGRTAARRRAEIRGRFGFREAPVADAEMLTVWLCDHVAGEGSGAIEPMIERLEARCRELAIEPPTPDRGERIARTALHTHEDRFHNGVYDRLALAARDAWMPCCARQGRPRGCYRGRERRQRTCGAFATARQSGPPQPCQHAGCVGEAGTAAPD